jgi:transcription antitermination factor NusG
MLKIEFFEGSFMTIGPLYLIVLGYSMNELLEEVKEHIKNYGEEYKNKRILRLIFIFIFKKLDAKLIYEKRRPKPKHSTELTEKLFSKYIFS